MIGTDDWVEGETGERTYTLENIDPVTKVVSPESLAGKTVELMAYKQDGTPVDTSGDVTIASAGAGTVTFAPDSTDLLAARSPLSIRFKVTGSNGKFKFFPKGEADRWTIRKR
jgi:hypothetical protein